MSKSGKIKALLALKDKKNMDYANILNLARPQALTTKYSRESFTSNDLIKLAELTNTRLAFIDENSKPVVVFDKEDLE
ncbi:hypothetical protein [Thomasclavelia cocleata]|jgi:hypothetical protein|uniref:hypothetical protein n=1 Tax=Thomasclavelia cocleata TaxID=69824 RepID=UPI002430B647|nr:hypothetical protein [Thomasclavelia cocleata]